MAKKMSDLDKAATRAAQTIDGLDFDEIVDFMRYLLTENQISAVAELTQAYNDCEESY